MAASFPNAKKTFSAVVNGVTKLVAALFNSPYDEIEAIETFIGATGGGAQAYSDSLTNLLFNYRRGCAIEYKSAADIYVRLGEIMVTDASGNRRLRRNTSDTTVTWSNIDTGSEANSTTYYVYAVADASATTFTVKISTNSSTPSGCTFYKRLGSFYNDASGNIKQSSITNDDVTGLITDIRDFGTSGSSYTSKTMGSLKIAYGSISVGASTSASISNLPFTDANSYRMVIAFNMSSIPGLSIGVTQDSGSQATIYNPNSATEQINWMAIGT